MRSLGLAISIAMWIVSAAVSAATPDLSGIWLPSDRNFFIPAAAQNVPGAPPKHGAPNTPPYQPDWDNRYKKLVADARLGKVSNDPTARCLPPGMPRTMSTPFPMEISIEKDRVLILFEVGGVRRIWTDGRKHPTENDLQPTFIGDSVGQWDGDTLVVDTVGLRGDTVFDATGAPHSDHMHIVERIRRLSKDKLEDEITTEDPVAFTKPWKVVHTYDLEPNWQIMEYVCEENNRGVSPAVPDTK